MSRRRLAVTAAAVAVAAVLLAASCCCEARDFYVGGRDGWTTDPSEPYNRWAERNRFQVHDRLVFRYSKKEDSVVVVSQSHYDGCNATDPLLRDGGGESTFVFDNSGSFFFISGDPARCHAGERLIVVVLAVRNNTTSPSPPAIPASVPPSPPPSPAAAGTNGTAPALAPQSPPPPSPPAGGSFTAPAPGSTNGTAALAPAPGTNGTASSAASLRGDGGALLILVVVIAAAGAMSLV